MTVEIHEGEDGAEAAEAGAEAGEAAAEAAEAVAEGAEAVAEAAETVAEAAEEIAEGGDDGGDGHTDGELEQAAALGALAQSHADHLAGEHLTADEVRAISRATLWEEAAALAELAAAEAEPEPTETIVQTDVPENDRETNRGLRRFL